MIYNSRPTKYPAPAPRPSWVPRSAEIVTTAEEVLQRISDLTLGADGTSTATGDVFGYDGTQVWFRRYDPQGASRHGEGYEYDNIIVTVAPDAEITFERTPVPTNELLTRFPTAGVTGVLIAPYVVDGTSRDSHWR